MEKKLAVAESVSQPFSYTGREYDGESGLYFYRARYLDATTGRFLSEDPIRLRAGDQNFYRYVRNNPLNFRDPSGLLDISIPGVNSPQGTTNNNPFDPFNQSADPTDTLMNPVDPAPSPFEQTQEKLGNALSCPSVPPQSGRLDFDIIKNPFGPANPFEGPLPGPGEFQGPQIQLHIPFNLPN